MGTNSGQPIDQDPVDLAHRQQGIHDAMQHEEYGVSFVQEDALPDGVDWVFIEVDDTLYFAIKKDRVTAETLADAWAAFRLLECPAPV